MTPHILIIGTANTISAQLRAIQVLGILPNGRTIGGETPDGDCTTHPQAVRPLKLGALPMGG